MRSQFIQIFSITPNTVFNKLRKNFTMASVVIFSLFILAILFVSLCYFCYINDFDHRLLEQILNVGVASLLVSFWITNQVYFQAPKEDLKTEAIVNIEYIHGGMPRVINEKTVRPNGAKKLIAWQDYVATWNSFFLRKTMHVKGLEGLSKENAEFQFLQFYILKILNDEFSNGWNHDRSRLTRDIIGEHGSSNSGVPDNLMIKVDLKYIASQKKSKNVFIANYTKPLTLAVPLGTEVIIDHDENYFTIRFKNKRFNHWIGIESSKALFTGYGFRNLPQGRLFDQISKNFHEPGYIISTKAIKIRSYRLSSSFQQSPWRRFSFKSDLDILFGTNVYGFLIDRMSWTGLSQDYETAVFRSTSE